MKQSVLPTVGTLLVCAALLGGPALWARLGDARRTELVTARPVTAGALDEDARAIPVLYELHAGSTYTDPDAPAELPAPDSAALCAEAAQPVAALAEAGVLSSREKADLDALLARTPDQISRGTDGSLQNLSLQWFGESTTAGLYLVRQEATGVYVSCSLPVGGDLDGETRLRAWLALLGVDSLGDWEPADTDVPDTTALYSAKARATVLCTALDSWVYLELLKGQPTF